MMNDATCASARSFKRRSVFSFLRRRRRHRRNDSRVNSRLSIPPRRRSFPDVPVTVPLYNNISPRGCIIAVFFLHFVEVFTSPRSFEDSSNNMT